MECDASLFVLEYVAFAFTPEILDRSAAFLQSGDHLLRLVNFDSLIVCTVRDEHWDFDLIDMEQRRSASQHLPIGLRVADLNV